MDLHYPFENLNDRLPPHNDDMAEISFGVEKMEYILSELDSSLREIHFS